MAIASEMGNGMLAITSGIKLTIGESDCPGDGHGRGNPGQCNENFGYDHQGRYGDEYGRSLHATMYAIVKIAQEGDCMKQGWRTRSPESLRRRLADGC
ncbi:hypothetical protein [Burkholderia stagnalis]|uniref:hypothetical protein n=1 Tax=Burkholderia stagnalis TaxID=1503054 RepID=UPI000F806B54|nr:hypothetical protein [Burkholderia stagnalis]